MAEAMADRVTRFGNRGIHEHAVAAEFHGDGSIRRSANARIH